MSGVRSVRTVPSVLLRRGTAKEAELLVLRHENAVLHPRDESGVGALRALIPEVSAIDPPSFESPVQSWQLLLMFSLRSIAAE